MFKQAREKIAMVITLFGNILMWFFPLCIFLLTVFVAVYFLGVDFYEYLDLLKILIWPVTLLLGLFFFRKVVTYMFFSMSEFNFFGTKGELKSVTEVIEENVEKRIKEKKGEEEGVAKIKAMTEDLERANLSKEDSIKKAGEYQALAREFLKDYKELSEKHVETTKNLEIFRQKEVFRKARTQAFLDKIKRNREESHAPISDDGEDKAISSSATDSTNKSVLPKGEPKKN